MTEYHADDYGLFPEQSRHIIDCYHRGALNGISIMPNSPYLSACMDEIKDIKDKLFITVHLNFVEGKPLTGSNADRLTNDAGNFDIGFLKLLIISYIPVLRLFYKKQLATEIKAQLKACEPYMNNGEFRIDGHVHYHMIPVVFDALMDILKAEDYKVTYIRFPKEELGIYSKAFGKVKDIKPINLVKSLILNVLSVRNERKYGEDLRRMGVKSKFFMGVMLSGHMFYENVMACLPYAGDVLADRGESEMELLFHPGDVSVPEDIERLTSKDDYEFLTSANRKKEAEALKKLGSNIAR
ncbi:MAG: ChbG/HpnK family deacetylase [Butyrivibrio sp.]|nr:ChbG/HpnK family deacetylase [Butyrivibrio sp.]